MGRQLPREGEVFVDHVAHFVPEMATAAERLTGLGFTLTPLAYQQNQTPEGPVPAGMANRCVMLRQGYLEFLTAVSDTPLARRFHAAVERYVGLHLVALGEANPDAAHARLAGAGFAPDAPVHLRRPVELPDGGTAEAQFTVLRLPADRMPEGRIQIVSHHTEAAVWQPRWLDHANSAESLDAVLLAVDDPEEAAARFGRFAGRQPQRREDGRQVLALDRGALVFVEAGRLGDVAPWAGTVPAVPWIVGYGLGSRDPGVTRDCFAAGGIEASDSGAAEASYVLPSPLGGFVTVGVPLGLPSWAV